MKKWQMKQTLMGKRGGFNNRSIFGGREQFRQMLMGQCRPFQGGSKPRDPNAMDVDVAEANSFNTRPKTQYKCFNCDKPGHFAKDCQLPKRPRKYCTHCQRIGHDTRECYSKQCQQQGTAQIREVQTEPIKEPAKKSDSEVMKEFLNGV
jgi:hypothetical protein